HAAIGFVPAALALQRRDLREIEGMQDGARRGEAADPLLNLAIEEPVIDGGGFPAHPAQHADGFHAPQANSRAGARAAPPLHGSSSSAPRRGFKAARGSL